jgi:hypothetical protein
MKHWQGGWHQVFKRSIATAVVGVLVMVLCAEAVSVGTLPDSSTLVPSTELPPVHAPNPPATPAVPTPVSTAPPEQPPELRATSQLASTATGASTQSQTVQHAASGGISRSASGATAASQSSSAPASRVSTAPGAPAVTPSRGTQVATPASVVAARAEQRRLERRHALRERKLRRLVARLSGCLGGLSSPERRVLALRAGLGAAPALSRNDVASRLRISSRRVRRLELHGVKGLRRLAGSGGCGGKGSESGTSTGTSAGSFAGTVVASLPVVRGPALFTRGATVIRHQLGAEGKQAVLGVSRGFKGASAPSSKRNTPAAATESAAPPPWLLVTLGMLILSAIIAMSWRQLRSAPAAASRAVLAPVPTVPRRHSWACPSCSGQRRAVNLDRGLYRCIDCGHRGSLS